MIAYVGEPRPDHDGPVTWLPARRNAPAADHPCQLYTHFGQPVVIRTQHHHRYPEYLQRRVFGRTELDGPDDMLWVCGLCHDSLHEVIDWLLGEGREPNPHPGRKTLTEAQRTVSWYLEAIA